MDAFSAKFPWNSPYSFSENVVINAIEWEGLEREVHINSKWFTKKIAELDLATDDGIKEAKRLALKAVNTTAPANDPNAFDGKNAATMIDVRMNGNPSPVEVSSLLRVYGTNEEGELYLLFDEITPKQEAINDELKATNAKRIKERLIDERTFVWNNDESKEDFLDVEPIFHNKDIKEAGLERIGGGGSNMAKILSKSFRKGGPMSFVDLWSLNDSKLMLLVKGHLRAHGDGATIGIPYEERPGENDGGGILRITYHDGPDGGSFEIQERPWNPSFPKIVKNKNNDQQNSGKSKSGT